MTEQNDTKYEEDSERRQCDRRSGEDRRKISLPVDNDRRKGERRSGKDRRQNSNCS